MIKLRSGGAIVLGLSRENLNRLQADQPILFDGGEIGLPGLSIGIIFGETESDMVKEMIDAGWKIPQ